jgi:hypothetical protein
MVVHLIRLRFIQVYRGLANVGLLRVVFLAVVILPLVTLFLVQRIAVPPWPYIFPGFVLYITWLVHSRRRDYHFLTAIVFRPRVLFLWEYILFTLPVTALLLSEALYVHAIVFTAAMLVIASSVPTRNVVNSRTLKLRMIPAGMFEWQSGIRKNLVVLVLFYIPGLFGFYHLWLSGLSLLILTLVFVSFYSEYEPRNMLIAGGSGLLQFLLGKVARHTGLFAMIVLPLIIASLVHEEIRWLTAGYFLASLNLMAFSILLKYYQYRPGVYSGAHQMLTTLACIISIILPTALFFAVCNLFLIVGAIGNLKTYFDADN